MSPNRSPVHRRNIEKMQPEFWQERWRDGQIGFHQSSAHPLLVRYWQELAVPKQARVLVPLCGKSLDLLWLRDAGYSVIGVELSALAVEAFCLENGVPARRRVVDKFDIFESPGLTVFCGDFFALTPTLLGPVSAIYDRAALVAWPEALREPYLEHLRKLTQSGDVTDPRKSTDSGELPDSHKLTTSRTPTLLITLEYPQPQMPGPPFSVSRDEVERLYSRDHAIEELSRQDVLPTEPRMRARGLTRFDEVAYRLTRW
jgi:thiopurine S-methyltransferase